MNNIKVLSQTRQHHYYTVSVLFLIQFFQRRTNRRDHKGRKIAILPLNCVFNRFYHIIRKPYGLIGGWRCRRNFELSHRKNLTVSIAFVLLIFYSICFRKYALHLQRIFDIMRKSNLTCKRGNLHAAHSVRSHGTFSLLYQVSPCASFCDSAWNKAYCTKHTFSGRTFRNPARISEIGSKCTKAALAPGVTFVMA